MPIASITRGLSLPSSGELAERLQRLLVLLDARHEDRGMVACDAAEILVGANAKDTRLSGLRERAVVVLQAELAEAEERIRRRRFSARGASPPERVAALRVSVEL